jgi:hypothetical protein
MKFRLFFITVFFFNYSIERTINDYEDIMNSDQNLIMTTEEVSNTTCKYTNKKIYDI